MTPLECHGLKLAYGRRTLLEGVDLTLDEGELVALVGRNGTGKSTLLRAIAGLEPVRAGRILLCGRDVRGLDTRRRADAVSFVTTERPRTDYLTVEQVVGMGRAPYTDWLGRLGRSDREAVRAAIDEVGLAGFDRKRLAAMSDGECQRAMIARALAQDTPIILLDEPTAFLDLPGRYEIGALLARLAHEGGKTILFSTHELEIARSLTDRIALIDPPTIRLDKADTLVAEGGFARLFSSSHVRYDPGSGMVRFRSGTEADDFLQK